MSGRKPEERRQASVERSRPLGLEPAMDDPEQSKRFMEAARDLGCEETGEAYDRALERILPPRKPGEPAPRVVKEAKPKRKRARTKGA
jgi:hypothetical protein